jgi:hypothetical protein
MDVRRLTASVDSDGAGVIVAVQDCFESNLIRAFEGHHPPGSVVRSANAYANSVQKRDGLDFDLPSYSRILGKANPKLVLEMQSKLRAECRRVGYKAPLVFHPGPWYRVIED